MPGVLVKTVAGAAEPTLSHQARFPGQMWQQVAAKMAVGLSS